MRKFLPCGLIVAVIQFISVAQAFGQCVDIGDTNEKKVAGWLKESTATFRGKVVKLEEVPGTLDLIATFSVYEIWKGSLSATVKVKDTMSSESTNLQFGTPYIVYAFGPARSLVVWGCTGTADAREPWAKEQIKILGKGKPPEKEPPSQNRLH